MLLEHLRNPNQHKVDQIEILGKLVDVARLKLTLAEIPHEGSLVELKLVMLLLNDSSLYCVFNIVLDSDSTSFGDIIVHKNGT